MIDKNLKPELEKDVVWKKEGKDGIRVSLASYLGGPIRLLNPVASRIIEHIDGKHTVNDIIQHVLNNFENAELDIVEKDVESFLKTLEEKKVIKPLTSE